MKVSDRKEKHLCEQVALPSFFSVKQGIKDLAQISAVIQAATSAFTEQPKKENKKANKLLVT